MHGHASASGSTPEGMDLNVIPQSLYLEKPNTQYGIQSQFVLETRQSLPILYKIKVKGGVFNRYDAKPKIGIVRSRHPVCVQVQVNKTDAAYVKDSMRIDYCFLSGIEAKSTPESLWQLVKDGPHRQISVRLLTIHYRDALQPESSPIRGSPKSTRRDRSSNGFHVGRSVVSNRVSPPEVAGTTTTSIGFDTSRNLRDVSGVSSPTKLDDAMDIDDAPQPQRRDSGFVSVYGDDHDSEDVDAGDIYLRPPDLPEFRPLSPLRLDDPKGFIVQFQDWLVDGPEPEPEETSRPSSRATVRGHPSEPIEYNSSPPSEICRPGPPLQAPVARYDWEWITFLPVTGEVPGQLRKAGGNPRAQGAFSDVWICHLVYSGKDDVYQVAMKVLRAVRLRDTSENEALSRMRARLDRELEVWKGLRHPHIAPLVGYTLEPDLAFISPWYESGNIKDYLVKNRLPHTSLMKLCCQVASALCYLHSKAVVHGDIKSDNVVIGEDGSAIIIDFGLSKALEGVPAVATSLREAGNLRWLAPELVFDESCIRTPQTDVWSFGALALEVLTGRGPFERYSRDVDLIMGMQRQEPPLAETELRPLLSSAVTTVLCQTWHPKANLRPGMIHVQSVFARIGGVALS